MGELINNNLRNDFCCQIFRGWINEKGIVASIKVGDVILQIDQRYLRSTKAKQILGCGPKITAQEIYTEMVAEDLKIAQCHAILKQHSHDISVSVEG